MVRFHLILEVIALIIIILLFLLIYYLIRKLQYKNQELNLEPFYETINIYSPVFTVFRDTQGKIIRNDIIDAQWAKELTKHTISANELNEQGALKSVHELKGKKGAVDYTTEINQPTRILKISSVPVYDASNKLIGIVDFVLDVSVHDRLEKDYRASLKTIDFYTNMSSEMMANLYGETDFFRLARNVANFFGCDFSHLWRVDSQAATQLILMPLTAALPFNINTKTNSIDSFYGMVNKSFSTNKPVFVEKMLVNSAEFPFAWQGERRNLCVLPLASSNSKPVGVMVLANINDESMIHAGNAMLVSLLIAWIISIAERNKREKKSFLAKKEELQRLATLMDNIPGVVFTCKKNTQWDMVFLSKGTLELTGYAVDEIIHGGVSFIQIIHPDDKSNVARELEMGLAINDEFQFTCRILTKTNTIKWVWVRGKSKGLTRSDLMLLEGIIIDVTEKIQNEAIAAESDLMFRSLFDMGNIAMGVIERDGSFSLVNTKLKQLLDLQPEDDTKLCWSQIIIPEEIDYDNLIFSKLESGELKSYQSEKRLVKPNGSIVYTHSTLFLLKNEYLKTFKFVVSFIDISDRMNLERRVLNTMIDTEEKERARMARELHDGVGPLLSSLKMYFQWMQMKESKANKEELMADAETLIDQTLQTIRDISFNLSPHLLQNYGLIIALESFIGKVKGVGNINFHFNPNGLYGRIGEEKELIMYRALTECINNTLKYANAQNVYIDFLINDGLLCVCYRDDGIGFDADEVLERKTGMGLFNLQSRLMAINGNVRFKSETGKGCHIELELTI
jgi:PAS domain S-box-containing protein